MNNKVVITGANHQNALGVIESLGRKGIKPFVIVQSKSKKSFILKSKYIEQGWICSTDEDVVECLMQKFTDTENKTVLFTCSDNAASLVDNNLNKLNEFFYLPNAGEQGELSSWMNKEKMTKSAVMFDIATPKSWLIKTGDKIHEVEYPCITKPITSVKNGKADFKICYDVDDLKVFLKNHHNCPVFQIQKYIDKDFEFQFLGCSLDCGQIIIIPGRTHIQNANNFNNLVFLKFGRIESSFNDLLKKCKNYIQHIGYSGLFSIEFLRGKDGVDYFLEINFRNDGNAISVTDSGTNLPFIWYLYNIGEDYKTEIAKSKIKEVFFVPEDSHFLKMINGSLSFKVWKNNMRKANSFATYFKEDKAPFFALIKLQRKVLVKSIIKRILKELHLIRSN